MKIREKIKPKNYFFCQVLTLTSVHSSRQLLDARLAIWRDFCDSIRGVGSRGVMATRFSKAEIDNLLVVLTHPQSLDLPPSLSII